MDSRTTGGWNSRADKPVNGYRDGSSQPRGTGMGHVMGQMNGRRPQAYQPPDMKRGICRDYHSMFRPQFLGLEISHILRQWLLCPRRFL